MFEIICRRKFLKDCGMATGAILGLGLASNQAQAARSRPIRAKDRVRVKQGTFEAMEGRVDEVYEPRRLVRITITILGRPVPVELEETQVELVE
jgi:transcription antitermination factor NusG